MAQMAVRKKRPKNLDLMTIRLPMPGILSIVHRISGAGIFLMLPVLLWLLQGSLASPETFDAVLAVLAHPLARLLLLGLVWFYLHHFCAGIRYLILDLHIGMDKVSAQKSAGVVFGVSLALTVVFSLVDIPFRCPAILYTWVALLAAMPAMSLVRPAGASGAAAGVWQTDPSQRTER